MQGLKRKEGARTYVFPVELIAEPDGRWSVTCPALPGCTSWARTRDEALANIQKGVAAYVEDMLANGERIPAGVRVLNRAAVTTAL